MSRSRAVVLVAIAALLAVLGWSATQLLVASRQGIAQSERWVASRAESALTRELLRIQTEINSGIAGKLYDQYEVYSIKNYADANPGTPGDEKLKKLLFTSPSYPRAAREQELEGACLIYFTVAPSGAVADAQVKDCPEPFHAELVETALGWRFEPVLEDGVAVEHSSSLKTRFTLPKNRKPSDDAVVYVYRKQLRTFDTKYDLKVHRALEQRMRQAARRWEPGESTAQLVIEEETPFLLVYAQDQSEVWVFSWDRVAAMVEDRSGARITLDPSAGRRRLATGRVLVGPDVWLHDRIWSGYVHNRTGPGLFWVLLSSHWVLPPSGNGLRLLLGSVLSLTWVGILVGLRLNRRAREQATAEARDALLQRISHELRTPAASVLSMAGVLESADSLSPEEHRQFLVLLREEAGRLAGGLDRLLRAARGEAAEVLDPIPLDLTEWIEETAHRWRLRIPSLTLYSPSEPVVIQADPERLDEAVDVLLDNALKYGEAPVTLRLTSRAGAVRITVTDSGPGILRADRQRIFDRLIRSARSDQPGGFGIGLWAARQVAEAHGGRLTLKDASSFVLMLPGDR